MRPACSIVIPTWEAKDLVDRCLHHLLEAIQVGYDEIVVVDDGSRDGTSEMIREKYPGVTVETFERNQGFGDACNHGVSCCRNTLVLLLNNDIIVNPDFLEPLTTHFSNENTFAVNAQVFQNDGSTPGGGLVRGYFHCGLLRLRWAKSQNDREHRSLTLYANGAATLIDKDKFQALGGFDRLFYPFYSEDLDLSYRAYQHGWVVLYEPGSTVLHDHGVTISGRYPSDYISHISKRNRIFFILKNVKNRITLMVCIFWLGLRFIGSMLVMEKVFLKAMIEVIINLSAIRQRRRSIKKDYVSDKKILTMTSEWYHR